MKIRRILATAVAAAVTTPVVFLSAAPAFADTKPTPASTQKPTPGDEDPDFAEYEKLIAAVTKAEEKVEALKAERLALLEDLRANKVSEAVQKELDAAKKAVEDAGLAKTTADAALVTARDALAKLEADPAATAEQKATATAAVTAAEAKVTEAVTAKATADERLKKADKAVGDELVKMSGQIDVLKEQIKVAEQELAAAEKALEEFEDDGFGDCKEDDAVKVALSGPKTVTAGKSAIFSLRVSNTSDRTLDGVEAYVDAVRLPAPGEILDDETDFADRIIPVEWSSADNLEWTSFTEEFDSIEVGKLVKGGHYDVKLRLTVAADTPAGKGAAFSFGAYDNNEGDCGIGEGFAQTQFDILAAKTDKPKPKPTPSETTATPTPAPTSGGNDNTTQQGGSSNTPVKGNLAATGANENLTQLGLAAAATVALGAGALVIARRRKAGTNA
ncbi:hypothetical protein [Streptomyces sp. NPDC058583]|uniref:hypothetical protein n=1 Tax=unclassified Streptomyces TaxID=2593676 RepID=UPI003664EDF8